MVDPIRQAIGQTLADAGEAAGLSQSEIARRMGVQSNTVCRYESGTNLPSLPVLVAYAEAIGVDPQDLFAEVCRAIQRTKNLQRLRQRNLPP